MKKIKSLQIATEKYIRLKDAIQQALFAPMQPFTFVPGGFYSNININDTDEGRFFVFDYCSANENYRCGIVHHNGAFLVVDCNQKILYCSKHCLARFGERSFHKNLKISILDELKIFLYNIIEYINNAIPDHWIIGDLGVVHTEKGKLEYLDLEYTGFLTYLTQSQLTKQQQIALGMLPRYPGSNP